MTEQMAETVQEIAVASQDQSTSAPGPRPRLTS